LPRSDPWCGLALATDDPQSDAEGLQGVQSLPAVDQRNIASGVVQILRGRKIFRFDTFGDEAFWGDTLGLHRAIAGRGERRRRRRLEPEGRSRARPQSRRERTAPQLRNELRRGRVDLTIRPSLSRY
jgi:hypothetical protein